MAVSSRKLRVQTDPSCFDLNTILESVRTEYPKLMYLGIWYHNGSVHVYAQSLERMSEIVLTKALEDRMVITGIVPYSTIKGELQEEWCSKPHRGNKSVVFKADTAAVFVHPLGEESLQHITSEFIVDLLETLPGPDVFYKFGLKMYSLTQNSNFRTRKGDKNVRVCCSRNGWITVPKEEAFDEILQILTEKTQEAVNGFRHKVPEYYFDHFEMHVDSILAYKDSTIPEQRRLYLRKRNSILNNIAVSVTDNLSRLSDWSGKKRKLVYRPPSGGILCHSA